MQKAKNRVLQSKMVKKLIGFSSVGLFVTLLSMLLTFILNELFKIDVFLTYIFSFSSTILVSYLMNTYLVFKSKIKIKNFILYCGTYLVSMALGLVILKVYDFLLPDWNKTLISYMVLPFTILFNFFFVSKILKS